MTVLGGVGMNAQRPVGDTIAYGGGGEYWYDTAYTNGSCAYYRYMSYLVFGIRVFLLEMHTYRFRCLIGTDICIFAI